MTTLSYAVVEACRKAQAFISSVPRLSKSWALLEEAIQLSSSPKPWAEDDAMEPINAAMEALLEFSTQGWDSPNSCRNAAVGMAALGELARLYEAWALAWAGSGEFADVVQFVQPAADYSYVEMAS